MLYIFPFCRLGNRGQGGEQSCPRPHSWGVTRYLSSNPCRPAGHGLVLMEEGTWDVGGQPGLRWPPWMTHRKMWEQRLIFHTGLIQELVQVGVLVVRPRFLMPGPVSCNFILFRWFISPELFLLSYNMYNIHLVIWIIFKVYSQFSGINDTHGVRQLSPLFPKLCHHPQLELWNHEAIIPHPLLPSGNF